MTVILLVYIEIFRKHIFTLFNVLVNRLESKICIFNLLFKLHSSSVLYYIYSCFHFFYFFIINFVLILKTLELFMKFLYYLEIDLISFLFPLGLMIVFLTFYTVVVSMISHYSLITFMEIPLLKLEEFLYLFDETINGFS